MRPQSSIVVRIQALLFLAVAAPAFGSTFILDNYSRTGTTESLTAHFTSPSTATTNTYSSLVEVVVSGTGYSLFSILNDAFHGVGSGAPLDPQYYQLNLGWTTAPLVPLVGEARNINNFIVFVEGVGSVAPGYTPAYSSSNTYHFVVDTGLALGQKLQFGVSDGNFGDNGGQYNVQVWQLAAGASAVPESAAPYTLIGLMLALSSALARRRRC